MSQSQGSCGLAINHNSKTCLMNSSFNTGIKKYSGRIPEKVEFFSTGRTGRTERKAWMDHEAS